MSSEIKMVNLVRQFKRYEQELTEAALTILRTGMFTLGRPVEDFERETESFLGGGCHTLGVASGTDAILIGLKALGVKHGDEVITSPFTFFATIEAIIHIGARPVFVDIDEETFNIDPAKIEAAITPKTTAIVPVHLYGHPADMKGIMEIAGKHNLKVLEDTAQAFGAEYNGKRVSTIGDAGSVSFFPGKNLGGAGDGGLIVFKDAEAREIARELRVHGEPRKYEHKRIGYTSRLDALQAAILSVKLKYYDGWNNIRAERVAQYNAHFSSLPVKTPVVKEGCTHIYHQYTLRVPERERFMAHLAERGIPCGIHYPKIMPELEPLAYLRFKAEDFPVALKASREVVSLPICPELLPEEVDTVAEAVKSFF